MTTQIAIQVDSRSLGPLPVGDPESSQLTEDRSHQQNQDHTVRPPLPSSSQTSSPSSSSASSSSTVSLSSSSSSSSTAPSPSSTCSLTACSSSSSLASSTTTTTAPTSAKTTLEPTSADTSVPASSQSCSQASSTTPPKPNSSNRIESTRAAKKQETREPQETGPRSSHTQQHPTGPTTPQQVTAGSIGDNCSTSQLSATPAASSTGKRRKMGKGLELMNDSGVPMDVEELCSSHTTGDSSSDRLGPVSNSATANAAAAATTYSSVPGSAVAATNQPATNNSRASSNNEAIAVTAATLGGGFFDDSGNSGGSTTDLHCNLSGGANNAETPATRASQDKSSSAAQPVHKGNNIRAFGELFDDDDLD